MYLSEPWLCRFRKSSSNQPPAPNYHQNYKPHSDDRENSSRVHGSFLPFIPSRNFHQNDHPRMNRRKWVSCDCDWPPSTQTRPTESSPKTSLASSFLVHCCTATAIKTALAISTAIVQRITPSVSVEKSHFILSILGRKSLIGRKMPPIADVACEPKKATWVVIVFKF